VCCGSRTQPGFQNTTYRFLLSVPTVLIFQPRSGITHAVHEVFGQGQTRLGSETRA
jgi:hypothetical protein